MPHPAYCLCDALPSGGRQSHAWTGNAADATPFTAFATGCRVSYWLDIPVVTPTEYQHLLNDSREADIMSAPIRGRAGSAADVHVPPAIEFGIDKSGQLAVASAPKLSDGSPEQQAPTCLVMDLATLDTESVILGVAATNARMQLGEALRIVTDSIALPHRAADSPQQQQSPTSACRLMHTVLSAALNIPLSKSLECIDHSGSDWLSYVHQCL